MGSGKRRNKRPRKKTHIKVNRPPGEAIYTGEFSEEKSNIILRSYDAENYSEELIDDIDKINVKDDNRIIWIEISGYNDVEVIKKLEEKFGIHSMLIEDILNADHLPKMEEGPDYLALVIKSFFPNQSNNEFLSNSVCILLKDGIVINLQEFKHSFFDPKIERIKLAKGRARKKGADYLFFVLLDAYVDTIYLVLDDIRDKLLDIEDQLLENPNENRIEQIHTVKRQLGDFRKYIFPLRPALTQLIQSESELIDDDNLVYFRDVKDHIDQLMEQYSSLNDIIKSLIDLDNSNTNNSINRVMKVLTIIATIFIPLTFIAGIYGMNFSNMPELNYEYGYPIILAIMISLGLTMVLFMKWKKWF